MIAHRLAALTLLTLAAFATGCSKSDSSGDAANPAFTDFKDVSKAPEKIRSAAEAVVRIETGDSYATGSFISPDGLLLTNNHVLGVDECPREGCFVKISLQHQRGQAYTEPVSVFVVPQHVDIGLDMAVVQTYTDGTKATKYTPTRSLTLVSHDTNSLLGMHINVVGHPEGKLKKWTQGDVAYSEGSWFQSTAFILPGNSGSPVLDDDGNVVGLVHRGPTAQDLVTKDDVNEYSIGTSSAPLISAMNAQLPSVVISTAAATTADQVVSHQIVYLNAHAGTVSIKAANGTDPPTQTTVLSLLGAACDAGLARTDYESPEDLAGAIQPCLDGQGWISCLPNADAPASCPANADKTAWASRFQAAYDHFRSLNGQLQYSLVSFAPGSLESSSQAANDTAQTKLQQAVTAANPPLDFELALYLSYFGVTNYANTSFTDYVTNYDKVPHYELELSNAAFTALLLQQQLGSSKTTNLLSQMQNDPKADLGSVLYSEEMRYEQGLLDTQ